jgi:hypothetical protein
MKNCWSNSSAYSANIDQKLYEKLTRLENTPLANAFFSKSNLDIIQLGVVNEVNNLIKTYNPKSKCKISRQSDREVMLLMVEFFYYQQQMLSTAHGLNTGRKDSICNEVPVPASFLFTDPGDSYIPGWFGEKKECNESDTFRQVKKYNPDTIPNRCTGNRQYYTDLPYYDKKLPMNIRVKELNKKFIDFLAPKVIYEIKNYLKYLYFDNDPYACFIDYPQYVGDRNDKGLSMQKYYTGKDEHFELEKRKNPSAFPKLKRHLGKEFYNCPRGPRTLEKDLINPQVKYGETDILFSRARLNREKRIHLE